MAILVFRCSTEEDATGSVSILAFPVFTVVRVDFRPPLTHRTQCAVLYISVREPSSLLESLLPRAQALQLLGHIPRGLALLVLDIELSSSLDKPTNADLVALDNGPMERREAGVVARVRGGGVVEKEVEGDRVA